MEEIKNGSIRISDEVIADIAIHAAKEVEGVATVHQRTFENAKSLVSSRTPMVKGVTLVPSENGLDITIRISVLFGCKVPDVCAAVQQEVADAVADMTGIEVNNVNVSVVGLAVAKASAAK